MRLQAMKIHQITYQDGQVSWREFGSPRVNALPLILLHGGHGSWEHWIKNIEFLAEHFQIFVPDMPGFGESSYFGGDLQSGMLKPLLASLNDLVGSDTAIHIAGFSFGGFVAAHLVNLRSGINRIALLGSAGHGGPRRPRGELLAWKALYESQNWSGLKEVLRENLYRHMIGEAERIDDLAIRVHQDACARTRFRSKPLARPGGLAEQLETYSGSSLLVWGEHDVTCTPDHVIEKLVDRHANRSKAIVQDAGHWVQYEKAEQVNQLLLEWFTSIQSV
jgi:pimeloyl-ACP methyl ester carboxylesterase